MEEFSDLMGLSAELGLENELAELGRDGRDSRGGAGGGREERRGVISQIPRYKKRIRPKKKKYASQSEQQREEYLAFRREQKEALHGQLPKNLKYLYTDENVPVFRVDKSAKIPQAMYSSVSQKILKFTDLFAPDPPFDAPIPREHRSRQQNEAEIESRATIDDVTYFELGNEAVEDPVEKLKLLLEEKARADSKTFSSSASSYSTKDLLKRPHFPSLAPPTALPPSAVLPPPSSLQNFSLVEWEKAIDWEGSGGGHGEDVVANSLEEEKRSGYDGDTESDRPPKGTEVKTVQEKVIETEAADIEMAETQDIDKGEGERVTSFSLRDRKEVLKKAEALGLVYHDVPHHATTDAPAPAQFGTTESSIASLLTGGGSGGVGKEGEGAGDDAMDIDGEEPNDVALAEEEQAEDGDEPEKDDPFALEPLTTSLFRPRNLALDDGSYLSAVIWDEEQPPPEDVLEQQTKLLLDPNDASMVFKGESESEEESEESVNELASTLVHVRGEKRRKRRTLKLPNRMMTAQDLLVRKKREAAKDEKLDRFNISNDKNYITHHSHQLADVQLNHSVPGKKIASQHTQPGIAALSAFHRPRVSLPPRISIPLRKVERARLNENNIIRHKKDLSARDGKLLTMEYMEEFPPILTSPGMGARVYNYYRLTGPGDEPSMVFPCGETVCLNETDRSPFITDIPQGHPISSFENNLYKVPIFRHKPRATDFLLVRPYDKNGKAKNILIVRELGNTLFTAGQILPLQRVPAPNSRQAKSTIETRLIAAIYRLYQEQYKENPSRPLKLRITDLQMAFPGQSDNSIRIKLRPISKYVKTGDESGGSVLNDLNALPDEGVVRDMTPPDEVALYDSMLAGAQRLHMFGISALHKVGPKLLQAVKTFPKTHRLYAIIKRIEEELQVTPWNLTTNFVDATLPIPKCALTLSGLGDPSGSGEAFAFLKQAQKIMHPRKTKKASSTPAATGTVTGTTADLRKLTSPELVNVLKTRCRMTDDEMDGKPRWKLVDLLRDFATEAKKTGGGDPWILQFARTHRVDMKLTQDNMETKLQVIWRNQLNALEREEPPTESSSDSESDEDLDFLNAELNKVHRKKKEALTAISSKKKSSTQTEEAAALSNFLRNVKANQNAENAEFRSTTTTVVGGGEDEYVFRPLTFTPSSSLQYIFKRTRAVEESDKDAVDLILDEETVTTILRHESRRNNSNQRFSLQNSELEEQKRILLKKEKRRLQERMRRQKKILDNQKLLQKRYLEGEVNGTLPGGNFTLICGRCGMRGHMKTNKSCPVYVGDEEVDQAEEENFKAATRVVVAPPKAPPTRRTRKRVREHDDGFSQEEEEPDEDYVEVKRPRHR
eukprot:TRINITY_DN12247_c0_g1_i1.p1 TRINITY_DN12247_c0_g1~~TRINITY_DN12247_c0_g1_i1.p1  ORF type:complete len:1348 (+),score=385.31 TRINITY_DN12247_c0_g1_i1:40-4083(+)